MFSNSNKVTFMESADEKFNLRQKNVFDELDKLEQSRPTNRYTQQQLSQSGKHRPVNSTKDKGLKSQFKGYESIFKTPQAPPPPKRWIKNMPDHQVNPHRWTRYSLEDVPERDMSEQSNTAAAMDFLRNRGLPVISLSDTKSSIKIAPKFTKVSSKTDIVLTGEIKSKSRHPLFAGSKREMPEYVVGQKQKKVKSEKPKPAETPDKSVKLSHLFDDE